MNGAPPVPTQPKKHGCLFYGCLTVLILALVGGIATYFGVRHVLKKLVTEYTDTRPLELPAVSFSPEQQDALKNKIDTFKAALNDKGAAPPLHLSADEINALIAEDRELKGHAHVAIEDNRVKAMLSLPMDKLPLPGAAGRYLNGTALLNVAVVNGQLFVTAQSVEVKGKPLPEDFMAGVRSRNLAEGAIKDPQTAALLAKIERLEVKAGEVIITPKTLPERP
jgi:hypothetical protein